MVPHFRYEPSLIPEQLHLMSHQEMGWDQPSGETGGPWTWPCLQTSKIKCRIPVGLGYACFCRHLQTRVHSGTLEFLQHSPYTHPGSKWNEFLELHRSQRANGELTFLSGLPCSSFFYSIMEYLRLANVIKKLLIYPTAGNAVSPNSWLTSYKGPHNTPHNSRVTSWWMVGACVKGEILLSHRKQWGFTIPLENPALSGTRISYWAHILKASQPPPKITTLGTTSKPLHFLSDVFSKMRGWNQILLTPECLVKEPRTTPYPISPNLPFIISTLMLTHSGTGTELSPVFELLHFSPFNSENIQNKHLSVVLCIWFSGPFRWILETELQIPREYLWKTHVAFHPACLTCDADGG